MDQRIPGGEAACRACGDELPPLQDSTAIDSIRAAGHRLAPEMLTWRRVVLVLLAGLAVLVGALYAWRNQIAERIVRRVIDRMEKTAASGGFQLRDVTFARAELAGFGIVTCTELRGILVLRDDAVRLGTNRFHFEIGRAHLALTGLFPGQVRAGVADGLLAALDLTGNETGVQLSGINAEVTSPVHWTELDASLSHWSQQARRLLREGRIAGPVRIEAVARFPVGGRIWEIAARASTEGDDAVFMLDREALTELARNHRHPLTPTEIDLVAQNPFRAPRMLAIAEQSILSAIDLRRRIRRFPYDAYRHVYWSWLLTMEFGPDFSEHITDAHEIGATYESGTASRRMDLHNNAVGRAYALAGVPESELLDRIMNDANIMRRPDLQVEVQSLGR